MGENSLMGTGHKYLFISQNIVLNSNYCYIHTNFLASMLIIRHQREN
ncbi:9830_t:CDS:2 [Dentiscutata heterogama]|uniref:9830_t:CDS:1 n=1 Tax=Dentiscutata heterogama TaxID=1316150 RepID=A0ACA9JUQ8_9GLOM|nr:9830_t:CDS:2 [Dentiscutata heterogama]